ncbi:MAG: calcium/sodium antiporter [Candidatus Saccharibacteria bacterium]|nr:calcium/sodium antiporter [Candidatus Saccharibacteria bacterium]
MIIGWIILFFVGLAALIKASDVFVDAASSLAIKLKMPKMLIALTIAAFGTCAPELAISFKSISSGNYDMTLANVIGSCVVNILLIVGVATLVKPIKVKEQTVKKELPILVLVTGIFFILLNDSLFRGKENGLSRIDAGILMASFGVFLAYILYVVHQAKKKMKRSRKREKAKYGLWKSLLYIVITLIIIVVASDIVVDNAVLIAQEIGISQKIITMTAIVIGTSLPELTMTVGASRKGEFDLAVGNIIGTNIFNICIVLGLPTLIYGGFTSVAFNFVDTTVVLLAALVYYWFGRSSRKLERFEGMLMVAIFAAYYTYLFLV